MAEWYYSRSGIRYGPVSAKQLSELVVSGRLQPTDDISVPGVGQAPAGKINGLLCEAARSGGMALLNIISRPLPKKLWSFDFLYPRMTVKFDGQLLGKVSLLNGFRYSLNIKPGRHTLSITVSRLLNVLHSSIPEKHYQLDLPRPLVYQIVFGCEWSGGMFKYQWRLDDAGVLSQQWEAERKLCQCSECGADWAVEFLGEKIIQAVDDLESRWTTDITRSVHENPNYGGFMPGSDRVPDYRLTLYSESQTQRQIMVPIQIQTCQHLFQCKACGKKWNKQFERKVDK